MSSILLKDNKKYRRVTEILSPFSNFSNIPADVLENAAKRGTIVHEWCELYAKKQLDLGACNNNQAKPYLDSFITWFDFLVDEVFFVEERLFCDKLMITGQIDLICKLKDSDNICVVDIKTPQTSSKSWRLQTAAYQYLATNSLNLKVSQRGCLMLDKKGGPPTFKNYKDYKRDSELFFSLCDLNTFFNS